MKKSTLSTAFVFFGIWFGLSACDSNTAITNTLATLTGTVTTAANGDLWVAISADLSVTDYGLGALSAAIPDPSNTAVTWGNISISPVVCSGSSSCVNGGEVTLSVDLTALAKVNSTSTNLPNGTAFPITLPTGAQLVAVPVGSAGALVYSAIGGGTYFVGTAIPFTGLDGAGKYSPGLDVFEPLAFDSGLITSYFGYFAGKQTNQTGVGIFADVSKLVASVQSTAVPAVAKTSELKQVSNRSEDEQTAFLYRLWKLGHDEHPVLRYTP